MSFINLDNRITKIILIVLSGIGAVSLTGVILLNLPFYYELGSGQSTFTFFLVSLSMFVLITFTLNEFLLSNLDFFREKKNIAFLILLIIFLSLIISVSSNYIWTTPETYAVEICFDAVDTTSPLIIRSLSHPKTNRLYPPDSFGFTRFPIIVESGHCVNGQLTTLLGRMLRYSRDAHLAVTIRENPPEGRFFISLNDVPSVVLFEDNDEQSQNQTILISDGFSVGSPWSSTWNRIGFYGIRVVLIGLSAIILSLCLFGITERTISYKSDDEI